MKKLRFSRSYEQKEVEAKVKVGSEYFVGHFTKEDGDWYLTTIEGKSTDYDFSKNGGKPPHRIRDLLEAISALIVVFREETGEEMIDPLPEVEF